MTQGESGELSGHPAGLLTKEFLPHKTVKIPWLGTSLVVQWLRL